MLINERARVYPVFSGKLSYTEIAFDQASIALSYSFATEVLLDKKHKVDRWEVCQSLYPHILCMETLNEKSIIPLERSFESKLRSLLKEAG